MTLELTMASKGVLDSKAETVNQRAGRISASAACKKTEPPSRDLYRQKNLGIVRAWLRISFAAVEQIAMPNLSSFSWKN